MARDHPASRDTIDPTRGFVLLIALGFFLRSCYAEGSDEPWQRSEKYAEVGTDVQLECILKSPECQALHDIKWYRDTASIFIFNEKTGRIRGDNDLAARSDIEYTTSSTEIYLKVRDLKFEDEGLYMCETTYSDDESNCNNTQHILLNVTMQPTSVRVIDEETKKPLSTGDTLGPVNEDSTISLYCESGKGKPVPTVEWFKGDQQLAATASSVVNGSGVGTGSSSLQMQITRDELGETFTCKVSSIALSEPLTVDIKPDIHVRPLNINLTGYVNHVVRGSNVFLQCTISSAKPPANITWYNGTQALKKNGKYKILPPEIVENEDGTSETTGYLGFKALEHDNGKTFSCLAENPVSQMKGLKPIKEMITIEVLYPPIIKIKELNITVNETDDFVVLCDYEANPATLTEVIWYKNGENITLDEDHYEGGVTEQTALVVKNASESDMASYSCVLKNIVGTSITEHMVNVSVLFKPTVEVTTNPKTPINEEKRINVSLTCDVISGNPPILTGVRWYLDGDLLKELPDCPMANDNTTTALVEESLCDIDPSKLLLEIVGRSFHGNYSCEGRNEAGWGPTSRDTAVIVYYRPGSAAVSYEPQQVIKGGAVTITCSVLDPGRPKRIGFKWFRGLTRLFDEREATLMIKPVNLTTRDNFTCLAYNEAGDGYPATAFIDVLVAPTLITKLEPYQGHLLGSENVSLVCWVECMPMCNMSWLMDGSPINLEETDLYYQSDIFLPADEENNHFESIQSTLVWNMTAWPNGRLDRSIDNVYFSCESTSNDAGPGVSSSIRFHTEYPPENMTISKNMINVTLGEIPETVTCDAQAYPEAEFRWFREGSNYTIIEGRVLDLNVRIPRRSNGTYFCEASNQHGKRNISVVVNVQFKPECRIEEERIGNENYLVCSAVANPQETDFFWTIESENDTSEQMGDLRDEKSYVLIDTSIAYFRTYVCIANNSIGQSVACEHDITGSVPWWYRMDGNLLLIIIVVTIVIIIALILICAVIYIICRRKRNQMKYSNEGVNNNHVDSLSDNVPEGQTKTFYENLPFHGIQAPPNKAFKPTFSDLDYADVDYRSYGPINYKAASIALFQKQQAEQQRQQQNQLQEWKPQMYGASDENEELL